MNSVAELMNNITPEIYQNLKRSVERGKWPTGDKLSSEQKQLCIQAIIAYEKKNMPPEEHTGYIETKKHTHCGSDKGDVVLGDASSKKDETSETQPLNFK